MNLGIGELSDGWIHDEREVEMCQVVNEGWSKLTIDSAAEESVCPKDWGKQFGTTQVEEDKKLKFVSATGGKIGHYGERKVVLNTKSTF